MPRCVHSGTTSKHIRSNHAPFQWLGCRVVYSTMKYPIEAFHSPHRLYWHPICTLTHINEKCWPSVSQVYSSTDSHCKPNTEEPRSAKTHKNWMRAYKQPDKAKQTHASKQHDGGHSKLTVYTVYPLATSPRVGNEGSKHATKIKTILVQYSNSYRQVAK